MRPAETVPAAKRSGAETVLLVLALAIMLAAPYLTYRGIQTFRDGWPTDINDFDVFYDTGGLVVSDVRDHLYDRDHRQTIPDRRHASIGEFFNPPIHALVFTPLTLLSFAAAKRTFATLSLAAMAAMWWVATRDRRQPAFMVVTAAAVISFLPLYDVLYLGHPTPFYALLVALATTALVDGRERLGGFWTGLLVLKPSLLPLPLAALALTRRSAALVALATGLVAGLAPFLITGPGSFGDYVSLLWQTRDDAFRMQGEITGGAALMFNWNGFFGHLLATDPSRLIVVPLALASMTLAFVAVKRNNVEEAYLAAVLATLIAVPHLLYYDWLILLPAGVIVAARSRDKVLLCLLAALDLAVNVSTLEYWASRPHAVFFATPLSLLVIAYLAFRPVAHAESRRAGADSPSETSAAVSPA